MPNSAESPYQPDELNLESFSKNNSNEEELNETETLSTHKVVDQSFLPNNSLFDAPAELKRIRTLTDPESHKQAVAEYKEKRTARIQAIADVQSAIISIIEQEPNINHEVLLERAVNIAQDAGFSQGLIDRVKLLIQRYVDGHTVVRRVRQEVPDDNELFEILFNAPPVGKITIEEHPLCLYINCYSMEDFTRAYLLGRPPTPNDIRNHRNFGAGRLAHVPAAEELNGKVIIANSSAEGYGDDIKWHELQHAEQFLYFERNFTELSPDQELASHLTSKDRSDGLLSKLIHQINRAEHDARQRDLHDIMVQIINKIDLVQYERTQDEILAFFRQGKTLAEIESMLESQYLPGYAVYAQKSYISALDALPLHLQGSFTQLAASSHINNAHAYLNKLDWTVWRSTRAIETLRDKNWPPDKIISLLMNIELKDWPIAAAKAGKYQATSNG